MSRSTRSKGISRDTSREKDIDEEFETNYESSKDSRPSRKSNSNSNSNSERGETSRFTSVKNDIYRKVAQANQWKKPENEFDLYVLAGILSRDDLWRILQNLIPTVIPEGGGTGSQVIKQKNNQKTYSKPEFLVMALTYPQSRQILFDTLKNTPMKGSDSKKEMIIPREALLGDYYIQIFPDSDGYPGNEPYSIQLANENLVPLITEESANNPELAPFLLTTPTGRKKASEKKGAPCIILNFKGAPPVDSITAKEIGDLQKKLFQAVLTEEWDEVDTERLDAINKLIELVLTSDNLVIDELVEDIQKRMS